MFHFADGTAVESEPAVVRGNPENPLDDRELTAKYRALTVPLIGPQRSALIEAAVAGLAADDGTLEELLTDLTLPLAREAHRLDAIPGAA